MALAVRKPLCLGMANLACSMASSHSTKTSPSWELATSLWSDQRIDLRDVAGTVLLLPASLLMEHSCHGAGFSAVHKYHKQ